MPYSQISVSLPRIPAARGIGWLSVFALLACSEDKREQSTAIYCGESFCLDSVSESDVTKVSPVLDFNRYFLKLSIGQVEVYEGNSPDIRNLERERVPELTHLNAWALSPTEAPAILIIVGHGWPETLVFSIERKEHSREQLVALLRGLRLKKNAESSI